MVFGGLVARQALGGIVTSLLAAFSACAAYYLGDSWWLGASQSGEVLERASFASYLPELGYWTLVAAIVAPFLGAVGAWQRRRELLGMLATTVIPAGATVEMLLPRRWPETDAGAETAVRWMVWLVSAVVIAWAVRRYVRWRNRPPEVAEPDAMTTGARPAPGQRVLVAVLASLSLIAGSTYLVAESGYLHPRQTGVGQTEAQAEASLVARIQVIGSDDRSATVTMTRSHQRDSGATPAIEFQIGTPRGIDWQDGSEYVAFLDATNPPDH